MLKFKKTLVLFWFLWWLIALWTDVTGALRHIHWLHAAWAQDNNYSFLVASLSMYAPPAWLPPALYTGIIIWSALGVVLFAHAGLALASPGELWLVRAERAFIVTLCFWLAFFIADQVVMKFDLEQNHMVQGGFQLLTFFSLYVLPDKQRLDVDKFDTKANKY